MDIKSPIASISKILDQIILLAEINRQTLERNEAATRAVLIDPLLRDLGWNTGNPNMVEVEKTDQNSRVDYALFDTNGDVKIIIESKKLGENLRQQASFLKIIKYAFALGVKDLFLTDGLLWLHYNKFEPGNNVPAKTIDLREKKIMDAVSYFVQKLDAANYWLTNKDIEEINQKVNQNESKISDLEVEIDKVKKLLNKNIIIKTDEEFKNIESIKEAKNTKPSKIKLPDNTVVEVNSWSGVLRECCKYVLDNSEHIRIPLPDIVGKKINLIDSRGPGKGLSYVEYKYKNKIVYIYTNYDSNKSIRNAIYIIDKISGKKDNSSNAVEIIYS